MKFRKTARHLNIRKRFDAVTANEVIKNKILTKQLKQLQRILRGDRITAVQRQHGNFIIRLISIRILRSLIDEAELMNLVDQRRTIDSFTDSECWNFFETRKEDLHRLLRGLRFPEDCTLDNGSKMSGEVIVIENLT